MSTFPSTAFNRSDTLLGVCQAIGQDFRIAPVVPRLAFAGLLFWNLPAAIGIYLALGAVVLASRLLFPSRPVDRTTAVTPVQPAGVNDDDAMPLAEAA